MENLKLLDVSIVICCYNSAKRLPETLKHLLEQDVPEEISWEVIVVDNASTDNTGEIAYSLWPTHAPAPLRVVKEVEPGLCHARIKGITEAKYEIVSFLDDDNWAAPNWIRLVSDIMSTHSEVGACGGKNEAVFESKPPFWFFHFQRSYAVGSQSRTMGDINIDRQWNGSHLWGAGLSIRKVAWKQLEETGFQPYATGRSGQLLTSGEDYELCDAIRISGWILWYDPSLIIKHFITSQRLTWSYLKKLHRGFGISNAFIDPYRFIIYNPKKLPKTLFGKYWLWQLFRSVYILVVRNSIKFLENSPFIFEGNKIILDNQLHIGKINALIKLRNNYDKNINKIRNEPWISNFIRIYDNACKGS